MGGAAGFSGLTTGLLGLGCSERVLGSVRGEGAGVAIIGAVAPASTPLLSALELSAGRTRGVAG